MGKRKARRQSIPRPRPPKLQKTSFECPICLGKDTVESTWKIKSYDCKLHCTRCHANHSAIISHEIFHPIDVYCDWCDQLNAQSLAKNSALSQHSHDSLSSGTVTVTSLTNLDDMTLHYSPIDYAKQRARAKSGRRVLGSSNRFRLSRQASPGLPGGDREYRGDHGTGSSSRQCREKSKDLFDHPLRDRFSSGCGQDDALKYEALWSEDEDEDETGEDQIELLWRQAKRVRAAY